MTSSAAVSAGRFAFRIVDEEDRREYVAVQRRAPGHSRYGVIASTSSEPPGSSEGAPRVMGAFDRADRLVAMAGVLPMVVRIGDRDVPGYGVLDVAVDLLRRSPGAARALVVRLLADERANGSAVSLVHPSAPVLHRYLGYEAITPLELRTLDRAVVEGATADPTVRVRGVRAGEDVLGPLSRHLEGALSPAPPAGVGVHDVVLERHGGTVGALRFERLPGHLIVHLLRAADAGAWATVLAVLDDGAGGADETRIEVWGGGDDDLIRWYPGRPRTRECSMPMLRVVDVVRALEGRGWPADVTGRWSLSVTDPLLPANTGTWILDLAGGRARVSASASRGVPVSLPRLAQLVAGITPVFGDAVPADLVRASVLRPWAGLFEF